MVMKEQESVLQKVELECSYPLTFMRDWSQDPYEYQ